MTTEILNTVPLTSTNMITELQSTTTELMQLIESLSQDKINVTPFEGSWTAAQIIRHVNMSDKGLLEMLRGPVKATLRQPDEKIKQISSHFLDFTIKMEAPEFVIPPNMEYDKDRLLYSFLQTRSQLSEAFKNSDLAVTCSLFSFPVYGELTRLELMSFITSHTERHNHQLKNIIQKITIMEMKVITKSIEIKAPKEKVWNVLLDDKSTRIWYAEFSEGTFAETDWKVGSKALFIDNTRSGMVSKVIVNNPGQMLSVEHQGIVMEGKEDYESEMAKAVKGGREIYMLSEKNGNTQLSIECDMAEQMFESMSLSWDKALQKIQELSENTPQ